MRRFGVILEPTRTGFSAHVPDLPGCVAAGATRKETLRLDLFQFLLAQLESHIYNFRLAAAVFQAEDDRFLVFGGKLLCPLTAGFGIGQVVFSEKNEPRFISENL